MFDSEVFWEKMVAITIIDLIIMNVNEEKLMDYIDDLPWYDTAS